MRQVQVQAQAQAFSLPLLVPQVREWMTPMIAAPLSNSSSLLEYLFSLFGLIVLEEEEEEEEVCAPVEIIQIAYQRNVCSAVGDSQLVCPGPGHGFFGLFRVFPHHCQCESRIE